MRLSYQPAYPLTGLAQGRWVREAMRSGMRMSLFQGFCQISRQLGSGLVAGSATDRLRVG